MACDPNKFYVEFSYPPAGFDSEAVRKIMCEWAQSDDSLLNQLLSYVDMGDLLKEVSEMFLSINSAYKLRHFFFC